MIIKKYIFKELAWHFIAVFVILLIIFISNQLIELLTQAAQGKLSLLVIGKLILLYSPDWLGLLIPISLFIAILFVFSKLYADNEIIILFNAGLGWNYFIKLCLILGLGLALASAGITLWLSPYLAGSREKLLATNSNTAFKNLIPGHFNVFNEGKSVIYVGEIDNSNNLEQIFVAMPVETTPNAINIITAQSGNLIIDAKQQQAIATFKNGNKYVGNLGDPDFFVVNFIEYTKQLFAKIKNPADIIKIKPSKELLRSRDCVDLAEFEWRLSAPIATIILSLIALALAKGSPRQGRFAKFLPGILIYITYSNAMLFMRRVVAASPEVGWVGIWNIHVMFLGLAGGLLLHASGWLLYLKQKFFYWLSN